MTFYCFQTIGGDHIDFDNYEEAESKLNEIREVGFIFKRDGRTIYYPLREIRKVEIHEIKE